MKIYNGIWYYMVLIKIKDTNSRSQTCTMYMMQLPVLYYYTHLQVLKMN